MPKLLPAPPLLGLPYYKYTTLELTTVINMASSISFPSTFPSLHRKYTFPSFPISVPCQCPTNTSASALLPLRFAAKSQAVDLSRNQGIRRGGRGKPAMLRMCRV
ncbi:hypothetical protein V6N13_085764 [Hibiscus sabdariffa]